MPRKAKTLGGSAPRGPDYRPSAAARGYDERWKRLRLLVLSERPLCADCHGRGLTVPATVVDHVIPISQGGARLDEANLRSLCKPCHDRKTATQDGGLGRARQGGVGP